AGNLAEFVGGDQLGERRFELADGAGGIVVSVTAEGILSLQFQEGADLIEDGGDVILIHGGNPKSETRNPKQIRISKKKTKKGGGDPSGFLLFYSDLFRISSFGFRIFRVTLLR